MLFSPIVGISFPSIENFISLHFPFSNDRRYIYRPIGLRSRVFTNGPGDRGSVPGRVIPKTQKVVHDAALLSTQYNKVRIKDKVEQSWEWSCPPPLHLGVVAIQKGVFGTPSTKVANFTYIYIYIYIYKESRRDRKRKRGRYIVTEWDR